MTISQELLTQANQFGEELIALRRALHQEPEFALDLPKTQEKILKAIDGLGEITLGKNLTSIVLVIEGAKPGPTVLLRADMDALSVQEETGLDFASTNGFMHACGHDLHMASGVGAAKLLHQNKDKLSGNVASWFQPGEEGHHGADVMIEEGLLEITG